MDEKEAFAILAAVCAAHNANLSEHQRIQKALNIIREAVFPEKKSEDENKE